MVKNLHSKKNVIFVGQTKNAHMAKIFFLRESINPHKKYDE